MKVYTCLTSIITSYHDSVSIWVTMWCCQDPGTIHWGYGMCNQAFAGTFCKDIVKVCAVTIILSAWPNGCQLSVLLSYIVVYCCDCVGWKVVSGGGDSVLKVWDLESGDVSAILSGHTQEVVSVTSILIIWYHRAAQITSPAVLIC